MQENDENINLNSIRKHDSDNGFGVPENYFHNMEEAILRKTVNIGFSTPEGYFENLSKKIENKIQQKQNPVVPLFNKKYWISGIAASLIAISGIVFWTMEKNPNNLQADLSSISDEEMIEYLAVEHFEEIPVEVIAASYNMKEIFLSEDEMIDAVEKRFDNGDAEILYKELLTIEL